MRRALSTAYYSLFHTLAKCCADLFVGDSPATRSNPAWRQVYRALEHKFCKSACKNKTILALFPKEIEDFGNQFVSMQQIRHLADYDPTTIYAMTEVLTAIDSCEQTIADFANAPESDRRAFAAHVLFKRRDD